MMRKYIIALFLFVFGTMTKAQYAELSKKIRLLEERKSKRIDNLELSNKNFLMIKNFEHHTERNFLIFNEDKVTLVEIFDDKNTGESTSKIFSGNVMKTENGIISVYCDMLEGNKMPLPITKNLVPYEQGKVIYLKDINTKEHWIDEKNFVKN